MATKRSTIRPEPNPANVRERIAQHAEVQDVRFRPLKDGDLVVVTIPKPEDKFDLVAMMNRVRDACIGTARNVGIVVMVEGCTLEIAEGAAHAASVQTAAAILDRRRKK